MKYKIIPVTAFKQNCSLVWCENTCEAALVDPGGEADKLIDEIKQQKLIVSQILLTHGHLDHVGAAAELAQRLHVPINGPSIEDNFLLSELPAHSRMFGFEECQPFTPDRWLQEDDQISIGNMCFTVLHCPGHTPGHIVFINHEASFALVGDVIFNGSVGRSDFPRGDHQQLIDSIRNKLLPLGDNITFIPGHGAISTFGNERKNNPFIR